MGWEVWDGMGSGMLGDGLGLGLRCAGADGYGMDGDGYGCFVLGGAGA